VNRDTAGLSPRTLGEILDQLVTEAGHEKPASFAELVAVAGLDPARDFVGGSLREVDLRGEDLRGFDFSGADLTGADFRGANLSGVSFNDAIRTGALGLPESTGDEIVAQTLRQFLNERLGSDGRISDWSYNSTANLLKLLGFRNLQQVETAISRYNDHTLSIIAMENRQGQTTRFELMLLAALGQQYIDRHHLRNYDWFRSHEAEKLKKFQNNGVPTSVYDPKVDTTEAETNR
jgi:Pentapeptide repeats (8 copies)